MNMQCESQASACFEDFPEHSGQMFDWWRYSQNGRIVHPPRVPPPPPPYRPPPLRTDQLCWPMFQVSRFENINKEEKKRDPDECDLSKDYWPERKKRCVDPPKLEHARPPWVPASNPNNTACCKGAPMYSRKLGDRQKPVQPAISTR
ncbi:hypothetical protein ElyMa_006618500 [Elysia marginata]|uniref:Uncharacterized protein n=1 Tax=Elysia marginata TaxID=1093978 RepID=A0AAV4IIG8_9GAST|nr:hypothetical protein ElyMa_006618500 [Elysia marginata]